MRSSVVSRALALAATALILSTTVVYADQLEADADALVAATPHANALEANQQAGTTVTYSLSAQIDNSGNSANDVFAAAGNTVTVGIARSGDWLSGSAGTPASFTFGAYLTPQAGTISVTVPCDAEDLSTKTMSAVLTASASNGQTLSPNSVTLTYVITATTPAAGSCVPADGTAPSAAITIDDGATWSTSSTGSVSIDISGTDAVGVTNYRLAETQAALAGATAQAVSPAETSFQRSDLSFTLTGSEATSKAVWLRLCDAAGNCADASDTIGWDHTAPTINNVGPTPALPNGNSPWYITAVSNAFSASDNVSGLDATCAATFPKNVSTGTNQGSSVSVVSGSCTDVAGNTNTGISSASFSIDLTNPTAAILSPADGLTTIALGITVAGTASDTPSGLATVTVNGVSTNNAASWTTNANAVSLSCGANTITATATDVAGRTNTASITVNRLCFSLQYLAPIDQSTTTAVVNTGKYGRVIPVKVVVGLAGSGPLDSDALGELGLTLQMGVNSATCASGAATDALEAYADAGQTASGGNVFRWDAASSQWIYNLDTKAPPSMQMTIGSCYRLDVYMSDGLNKVKISTSTYALFKPTK